MTESTVSELAASNVKMASTSQTHIASNACLTAPSVRDLQHAPSVLRVDMAPNVNTRATACVRTALVRHNVHPASLGGMDRFASFTVHWAVLTYCVRRTRGNVVSVADMDTF